MAVLGEASQVRHGGFLPLGEEQGDGVVEGRELGVAEDSRLHLGDGELELRVAGAVGFLEQCGAHRGDDLPVGCEGINVLVGDAAAQVGVDVLQVLRLGAVDVAREVEVVVVLRVGDLADGHEARVARDSSLPGEGVHDSVDVLLAEAVLRAVLLEALGGIDHEDAPAGCGVFLVEHEDAGGNAGAVEQIRRQADDGLDDAALDEIAANDALGIAAEEDAVREDARALTGALERAEDVQEIGKVALLGGRDAVVLEPLEGVVFGIETGAPAFVAERRIGDDVVERLQGIAIEKEWTGERVALLISAVA